MTQIYYKTPQNQFVKLTYQDFGAAAAYHTHEHTDITIKDASSLIDVEIPQIAQISQGGTGHGNWNRNNVAKILGTSITDYKLSQIPVDNGVLGYYNGNNKLPSFKPWPISAGGTGAISQNDAISNFQLGITNNATIVQEQETDYWTWNLNGEHILDAHLTNNCKAVEFSIYLPFQLLPNTVGWLDLYPLITVQPNLNSSATITSAALYPTYSYTPAATTTTPTPATITSAVLKGFSAKFITDYVSSTEAEEGNSTGLVTENCIYTYGYDSTTGYAGLTNTEPEGNVIIEAYSAGPKYNKNKLLYYQAGHILSVRMDFKTDIVSSGDNLPILLYLNYGLKSITNQIKISKSGN